MRALAAYVAENFASDLRMPDLAAHVHVSVRTLQNLFHSHCGEPPLKALRRFRLSAPRTRHGPSLDPLRELYRNPA